MFNLPIVCILPFSSITTVGGIAWKYLLTYPSLLWKGETWCTFSSQDEHMNFTGHSTHCTCTFPLKHKLQQLGEGKLLNARTASNNCFLELSQLEVKFIILVSQFFEDAGTPNELRKSLHLAKVASRVSSVEKILVWSITMISITMFYQIIRGM